MDHAVTTRSDKDILEYFDPKEHAKLVYLSPDATEVLTEFREDEVYIIGGIVDKTVKTGLTVDKAGELGVRVKRLYLEPFRTEKKFRLSLNINTVFNIIDNYRRQSEKNMEQAIASELPKRFKEGPKYTQSS